VHEPTGKIPAKQAIGGSAWPIASRNRLDRAIFGNSVGAIEAGAQPAFAAAAPLCSMGGAAFWQIWIGSVPGMVRDSLTGGSGS
jgi:hypothetical protein